VDLDEYDEYPCAFSALDRTNLPEFSPVYLFFLFFPFLFAVRSRARANAWQSEPAITRYNPGANDQSDHVATLREYGNSMAAEILQRDR
jgi:hypothetical protein